MTTNDLIGSGIAALIALWALIEFGKWMRWW